VPAPLEPTVTADHARPGVVDPTLLAELVAVSRTLGADADLVLHGGGNTSLKTGWRDVTGQVVPVLMVKGSGHDLADIGAGGFSPLRLDRLRALLPPLRLDHTTVWNELRCAALDAGAPDPSVETLVHALVPHAVVLHSHADALLALSDTADGEARVRAVLGAQVVVADYAMPGPDLVASCADAWAREAHEGTEAIVVLQHGLFALGADAAEALARHDAIITRVRAALAAQGVAPTGVAAADTSGDTAGPDATGADVPAERAVRLATLRRELCEVAGQALVMTTARDPEALALAGGTAAAALARGPITPDHVIWTKAFPADSTDVAAFAERYRTYLAAHRDRMDPAATLVDPAPRVVLDARLGIVTAGRTAAEAQATGEIARHALRVAAAAEQLGGYRPAELHHVFDLEHWAPQQEKMRRTGRAGGVLGRVALVTGAASGIGRACAAELLAQGAAVVGWDIADGVGGTFDDPAWLGLQVDVTDAAAVEAALVTCVEAFGGLDVLVISAGIFPRSETIEELSIDAWRRTMAVNVDAVAVLFGRAAPLLRVAVGGGDVVVVASKNVVAPGRGAAAYSASKAALAQLARVAALEWASDGVRVNMVHPDAVFDTGLWSPELLATRAEHYGLSVDEYKRRNLLRTEVTSHTVARMVRTMADGTFAATTGAQVAIDGGSERTV
jgi:rhamnose utilization protein RhaD (predicted bifunctional aldolase and dehydrogenase)/NAD(P)-dependent dehydrogenase (short-subunit alcohol dehydrogenase family)